MTYVACGGSHRLSPVATPISVAFASTLRTVNLIILGGIIGAVPTLLASWLALRGSRLTTELTLAGDHVRWLREKRSDLYIELLTIVNSSHSLRSKIAKGVEVTPDIINQQKVPGL